MGQRNEARHTIGIHVDQLGGNIEKPALVIANPFQRQRLAVPRDVQLGDTPEGDPAILWNVPGWVSRDRQSPDYARVDWATGAQAEQAIWAFLELASESEPERFVAFTRRFGPLGLWPYRTEHNKKIFELGDHWVPSIPDGIQTPYRYGGPIPGDEYQSLIASGLSSMLYEPVSEWRRWAVWFRAVLGIALALRSGSVGSREQWAVFGIDGDSYTRYVSDTKRQQRHLAAIMQFWFLKWSGLTPVIRWAGEHPLLELAFGGDAAVTIRRASMQHDWPENSLFPALVGSLLAIVTANTPVAACAMCGRTLPRERQPRGDQPTYCDRCRPEAIKANKRRSAARARAKRREGE